MNIIFSHAFPGAENTSRPDKVTGLIRQSGRYDLPSTARPRHPTRSRYHGVVLVYVALIGMVLLMLFGLACDTAYVYWTQAQLQNAADAAALAGAQTLLSGGTTRSSLTAAQNIALANRAGGAAVQVTTQPTTGADVQVGNYNSSTNTFTASGTPYNAVQVTARRNTGSLAGPLNLLFSPGIPGAPKTANVVCTAIALANSPANNGLIVLASSGTSVTLVGNASITVTNGNAVVDSSSNNAVSLSGNATISAPELVISGNDTGASGADPSGKVLLNQPVTADPYASLAAPARPAAASGGAPGYYAGGINIAGNTVMTLTGGIYYLDNGLSIAGNAVLNASAGCLIYVHTGAISVPGNGNFSYAPMSTGSYAGISIYQDRGDSTGDSLAGNGTTNTSGTLYLPAGAVTVVGNGKSLATQLICNTLSVNGNGQAIVTASSGTTSQTTYLVK